MVSCSSLTYRSSFSMDLTSIPNSTCTDEVNKTYFPSFNFALNTGNDFHRGHVAWFLHQCS